jgi:hypothetical protein
VWRRDNVETSAAGTPVSAATDVTSRPSRARAVCTTEALSRWLAGLPEVTETGRLTDQAALDDWARRNTLGLIELRRGG